MLNYVVSSERLAMPLKRIVYSVRARCYPAEKTWRKFGSQG
jgi:hypothetical protein